MGKMTWFPWSIWFAAGAAFAAVFMVLSVVILAFLAYNTITRKPIEKQLIYPVLPGVNLPMNELGYYLLTLLVCVVIHEAGHALAALRERVRLHGFGFFLFGIYPGAYVDLSETDLTSLSPIRQLKIYCAGIWHNGVIVLVSVLIFYALPWILNPGYIKDQGVGVIHVEKHSILTGTRGLHLGDAITQVNACPVTNPAEWFQCLTEAHTNPSGYCLSEAYMNSIVQPPPLPGARHLSAVVVIQPREDGADKSNQLEPVAGQGQVVPAAVGNAAASECCPPGLGMTHVCFKHMTGTPADRSGKKQNFVCLPARAVTEREPCKVPSDCGRVNADDGRPACLVPAPQHNATRLIRLVHNRVKSPPILYLGPVQDLASSIEISDYVPRWPHIIPCRLPSAIARTCVYLFSLSGALAFVNSVPCYTLDGQWILKCVLDVALPSVFCSRQIRRLIFSTTLLLGTGLLILNMVLALWFLFLDTHHP